jgi:hypothetical protein
MFVQPDVTVIYPLVEMLLNEVIKMQNIESTERCTVHMKALLEWKFHNGKNEIISFVVKYRSKPPLTVNFDV